MLFPRQVIGICHAEIVHRDLKIQFEHGAGVGILTEMNEIAQHLVAELVHERGVVSGLKQTDRRLAERASVIGELICPWSCA